jgi:hypothetical protein
VGWASTSGGLKGGASPSARSSPPAVRSSSSARRPWPAAGQSQHRVHPPGGSSARLRPRPGTERANRSARRRSRRVRARPSRAAPSIRSRQGAGLAHRPAGDQVLAPQQAEHRLLFASCRHSPPRLGRGPVCASVGGALRRAHAYPNSLVHPHLLAASYLQSGVSANRRPGDTLPQSQRISPARFRRGS